MEKVEMTCKACGCSQLVSKEDFVYNDELFCVKCDEYM